MLGLFPNSPSLTQLNPVASAVCIRTLSLWTLSLSRIKMTIRTPQATRGEGNAATLPYFIRSFKPCCTPIALLSGWGYVRVPAYADYLWGGSLTYYNYYIKSWQQCQVIFVLFFVSTVNIQDHVLLPIYDLYTFHLVCSSGGLNVTVHIHLLSIHPSAVINDFLYTFHHLSMLCDLGDRERNRTSPNQWSSFWLRSAKTIFDLSIDIETHDAFTISDTCHAVQVKQGSQSLSTLYLYYIKTRLKCQVFFCFILTLFQFLYHPI